MRIMLLALLSACILTSAAEPASTATGPLDFTLTAADGTAYPLAQWRGKVVLLINVASKCGFTKQYAGLQKLYADKQAQGFAIIGVPSNDFLGQEPGTNDEIQTFCSKTYGVTFPILAKAAVSGNDAIPLYRWLANDSAFPGRITWNFNKFLIGRDGQLVARFGSRTTADDAELVTAVDKELAVAAPSATTAR